jgi:fibronectin type 3 domain-containing protein
VAEAGTYPITKYTILRDGLQYATVKAPTTTYTDTAVISGTTYNYRVRATSAAGNSPLSATVTVTVP